MFTELDFKHNKPSRSLAAPPILFTCLEPYLAVILEVILQHLHIF